MKKLVLSLLMALGILSANAQCNEIFISEYVEGSGNNKALEIYNPTSNSIDLSKYRVTRWQNGSAVWGPQYSDSLKGLIGPNEVRVLVIDRRDTLNSGTDTPTALALRLKADIFLSKDYTKSFAMSFNGDDALSVDKWDVASSSWLPVDIFGKIGQRPQIPTNPNRTIGWSDSFPYYTGLGMWWTINHTMIRKGTVNRGVTTNPSFFNPKLEWTIQPNNLFDSLRTHNCICQKFPAGINTVNAIQALQVFPNPTSGMIQAFVKSDLEQTNITDMHGRTQTVKSGMIHTNGFNIVQISTDGLSSGIYFITGIDKQGNRYSGRFEKI